MHCWKNSGSGIMARQAVTPNTNLSMAEVAVTNNPRFGINGPMPAISNAIFHATGLRLNESPFTPEKVYMGLKEMG